MITAIRIEFEKTNKGGCQRIQNFQSFNIGIILFLQHYTSLHKLELIRKSSCENIGKVTLVHGDHVRELGGADKLQAKVYRRQRNGYVVMQHHHIIYTPCLPSRHASTLFLVLDHPT